MKDDGRLIEDKEVDVCREEAGILSRGEVCWFCADVPLVMV